ncbi:MAG: methylated-DNA--[protein]-cysteine S-methyltransferase [Archaeoglobaceae archaeon]|nr:methylated-DNA--[protein]-cysteine S-methyltransferase [Archaeoglobaceae archaeon]MCX8152080.1 methylated-DNA--[protein]-cysteine S-methyltransferase [Archaeoglobaceae archaeon]MDW8013515.1 methylated-DNA--[protein]-cysteine S-methyltransferase [Archaeoglobaceae archaeon]
MISVKFFNFYFNVEFKGDKVVRSFFSKKKIYFGENKLKKELERYFSGEEVDFSVEFELKVSNFTLSVLEEVLKIKYGKMKTYGEIAKKLKTSPRAVGQALKRNPIPVLIPCHRVVSEKGLGGYSQGIKIKEMLLKNEKSIFYTFQ